MTSFLSTLIVGILFGIYSTNGWMKLLIFIDALLNGFMMIFSLKLGDKYYPYIFYVCIKCIDYKYDKVFKQLTLTVVKSNTDSRMSIES